MSNKQNDELVDRAIDIVNEKMEKNPTIPEEARRQLETEELAKLSENDQPTEPEEMKIKSKYIKKIKTDDHTGWNLPYGADKSLYTE